ncbi:hypothetical protein AB0I77_42325 [Streptomyces sp. NPDC050619]|uniref:hypothetical protein n=1 Tax=Streptomyces sp. NPDC050619 TaxID=3157214 RepID=UPI0034340752
MLHIIDARTGEPVDAAPARRGLTRVVVHAAGYDPTALRVLLVADVLVRALELGSTPVWALLAGEREQAELRAAAAALGIRPFEDSRDAGTGPGEAQAIHVVGEGGGTTPVGTPLPEGVPAPEGVRIAVAPVDPSSSVIPEDAAPAAVRLALLSRRRSEPVRLDADALAEAQDTLARWRHAVADWARRPSRAIPEEARGRLRTAWEDDLDTPAVLRVLEWVEASDLPEGARFETYAYADRLLGLELTRDVGSLA